MSEPVQQPTPWTDDTKSIIADENISAALTEDQKTAMNTISDKTTYIRSNIALTNGAPLDSDALEHIPNLYTAVKTAFDFAIQGTTSDFGADGIKTDQIVYSTESNGDIVIVTNDYDAATQTGEQKRYSFKKIVDSILTLDARTQHMISIDNDKTIDMTADEPEPQPGP